MPGVEEVLENNGPGATSPLAAALGAGIDQISQGQQITFTLYRKVILPLDGFVFWVRDDLLSSSAQLNTSPVNSFALNAAEVVVEPAQQLGVQPASLHHTTLNQQDEAESFSLQQFVLTCQQAVDQLNAIAPDQLWIGDWQNLKLAFSSRTGYYRAANVYHYRGDALYPALASQIIDDPSQLDAVNVIVSNSLPIWLTLNQLFPVYPSYLVPDNVTPPYAAVHIGEDDTTPLVAAAYHDQTFSRWQLVKDKVKVTLYGVRNFQVMDWLDLVAEYTLNNPLVMGIMNTPVPRDAKRGQTEFSVLAQKKVITFEVSYNQLRVRDVARQYIKSVVISYNFGMEDIVDGVSQYVFWPASPVPPPL